MLRQIADTIGSSNWLTKFGKRIWLAKEAKALRSKLTRCSSLEELVAIALKDEWFETNQKPGEILALLTQVKRLVPQRICEIGSATGGTLGLFCQVAAPDAKLMSIDIDYSVARQKAHALLARPRQDITCLKADSHSLETLEQVKNWLGKDKIDFLFIDGDHSLKGVRADFEIYSALVRPEGIIAFHDVHPDFRHRFGTATMTDGGEVPMFWEELRSRVNDVMEFVDDPDQDGYGIGCVIQPKNPEHL